MSGSLLAIVGVALIAGGFFTLRAGSRLMWRFWVSRQRWSKPRPDRRRFGWLGLVLLLLGFISIVAGTVLVLVAVDA